MDYQLRREADQTWIDGITPWPLDEMAVSTIAAYAIALQATGETTGYHELMGASGTAFRLQVHADWCPSSPHPFCGYKTVAGLVAALPYAVATHEPAEEDQAGVAAARQAVVQSIDAGRAAVYGNEEDGLIIGYRKGGDEWLCIHPYRYKEGVFVDHRWPWGVGVLADRKDPQPDPVDLLRSALELALTMANTAKVEAYHCGFDAWQRWIEGLRDDSRFGAADDDQLRGLMMGNAWIYRSLVDARRSAAAYLQASADRAAAPSAVGPLSAAARHYDTQVSTILLSNELATIAPPPWRISNPREWSNEMRHEEAQILRSALAEERRAITAIEEALEAMKK